MSIFGYGFLTHSLVYFVVTFLTSILANLAIFAKSSSHMFREFSFVGGKGILTCL